MVQFKFRVTKEDIEMGIPRKPCFCPIARSVRRRFQELVGFEYVYVDVDYNDVQIYDGLGFSLDSSTSKKMEKFIRDFDDGKEVKPFTGVLRFQ